MHAKLPQLSATVCNPKDCGLPSYSVHGILQARILEWVVMPFSRASSQPRDWTCASCISCIAGGFFTTEPPRKPSNVLSGVYSHWGLSHPTQGKGPWQRSQNKWANSFLSPRAIPTPWGPPWNNKKSLWGEGDGGPAWADRDLSGAPMWMCPNTYTQGWLHNEIFQFLFWGSEVSMTLNQMFQHYPDALYILPFPKAVCLQVF